MTGRFWFARGGFVVLVFAWMAAAVDGGRAELAYVAAASAVSIVGAFLLARHEEEP